MSAAGLLAFAATLPQLASGGAWPGVDEAVVERVAAEAGRHPWRTPFALDGDVLLFSFLVAGIVGGFVLGYGYRALFHERPARGEERS